MKLRIPTLCITSLLAASLVAACGSGDVVDGDGSGTGLGGAGTGTGSNGGVSVGSTGSGAANGSGGGWIGEGCATHDASTALEPVNLVFLLDFSRSMFRSMGGNQDISDERWVPVTDAMEAFFSDNASAGLHASLTFFPTLSGGNNARCNADSYDEPDVDLTALPSDAFAQAFDDAVDLHAEGITATPTYPAYAGVVEHAQALHAADDGRKVAIVMVTDGQPQTCENNTIARTAELASDIATDIPTYVIGVGPSLEALNEIAASGGTESATMVEVGDPEATRDALLAQIRAIRGAQVSCEMPLPSPPEGQTLDPQKVNVEVTLGGETTGLSQNPDCEGGEGWRYDDAAAPRRLELCSDTCELVKSADDADVNVVFGCVTNVIVK